VEEHEDPIESLYRFENNRPWCVCTHPMEARLQYLKELVDSFRVDAVICLHMTYCHPFAYEAPLYEKELEAGGIPVKLLGIGHDKSGHGQLRTRIQAFIEQLEL